MDDLELQPLSWVGTTARQGADRPGFKPPGSVGLKQAVTPADCPSALAVAELPLGEIRPSKTAAFFKRLTEFLCHPRYMSDREVLWRAAFGFAFAAVLFLYIFGPRSF